ncbi:MAG: hypothetical protein HY474_01240 [Candidatus Sungbacteria bacterium]|uniref:Uncharacterized protein n=1 Tax=Candidatus Sungiibacteriota bacterium TaxID=2750080 RepID=A0A933DRJ9_9BACT|nr:hypothetical protein [Candidatus Sungbacteria bacterium]
MRKPYDSWWVPLLVVALSLIILAACQPPPYRPPMPFRSSGHAPMAGFFFS